jgi:hypothetical protein
LTGRPKRKCSPRDPYVEYIFNYILDRVKSKFDSAGLGYSIMEDFYVDNDEPSGYIEAGNFLTSSVIAIM